MQHEGKEAGQLQKYCVYCVYRSRISSNYSEKGDGKFKVYGDWEEVEMEEGVRNRL